MRGRLTDREAELEAKQSATGPSLVGSVSGRPQRLEANYKGYALEGYSQNAALSKGMNDIMEAVGSVELQAFEQQRKSTGEVEHVRLSDHPLEVLLKNPNPTQDSSEFRKELVMHLFLAGELFIESVNVQEQSTAAELYALRPDRMEVLPGPDGLPSAYRFKTWGGDPIIYPLDPVNHVGDVVHRRRPHPLNDWRGLSPILAAAFGLDTHNAANTWNLTSLQKGARPPAVLTIEGSTAEARREMRAELPEQMTGLDSGRGLMVLDGKNAKLNMMSYSAVELDWLMGKFQSAREVCWAIGYPSFLLGMPGDSTFNNQAEARLALWEQTVMPILRALVSTFNTWLAPRLDRRRQVFLKPDLESVPALSVRRDALWQRATSSDFLTINEKRKLVGYSPLEDQPEADLVFIEASKLPLGSDLGADE